MSVEQKVKIEELQNAVNVLLRLLRDSGIAEVELTKEYNWKMYADELYDVTKDPSDLTIGSLCENWQTVEELAGGKAEPVVLLLSKVANLLRFIANAVPETKLLPVRPDGSR